MFCFFLKLLCCARVNRSSVLNMMIGVCFISKQNGREYNVTRACISKTEILPNAKKSLNNPTSGLLFFRDEQCSAFKTNSTWPDVFALCMVNPSMEVTDTQEAPKSSFVISQEEFVRVIDIPGRWYNWCIMKRTVGSSSLFPSNAFCFFLTVYSLH